MLIKQTQDRCDQEILKTLEMQEDAMSHKGERN